MAEEIKQTIVEETPISGKKKASGSLRRAKMASRTAIYNILVLMSIIWLVPFVLIVLQSFRVETFANVGYIIPKQWGFDNYVTLFTEGPRFFTYFGIKVQLPKFVGWYINTLIIALFTAVLQTIIVLCMSYTLSRLRFSGRKLLMNLMLILGMFPGFLSMIILYFLLKDLNMTNGNSVAGLILVYCASSGMGYYVSKGFFDTVPKSLDEAARVDGATRAQVLTKVILPLSKPIVIYTVLSAFMGPWGDFMFARLVAMGDLSGYNAAIGMQSYLTLDQISTHFTVFCAAGVIVAIPVTALFLFLQKYYVEGVTGGAVKG